MSKVISIITLIVSTLGINHLHAQGNFFASTSQTMVEAGQVIMVTYTLEDADPNRFSNPDFSPFTVVSGPGKSTSISIINGQRSMKSTWRFQLLAPQKTGTYTLPSATVITAQNKQLKSSPIQIEVVENINSSQGNDRANSRNVPGEKDFFLAVEADSEVVYPGQLVVLTCKLYSRVDLVSIELISIPDIAESARFKLKQLNNNTVEETINGKRYFSKVIQRIAVFPQKPGNIKIDPYVIRVARSTGSDEDNWFPFSRNYDYETVASNPSELVVNALPMPAPETFSGAVGTYTASMYFDPPLAKAGQSLTATFRIRGVGDLKRFQAPEINWPEGIEQYDVLTTSEEYAELTTGLMGEKKFEYVLVPQEAGDYPLPTVFTYFDTEANDYKSVDLSDQILQIKEGTDPSFKQDLTTDEPEQEQMQKNTAEDEEAFSWRPMAMVGLGAILLLGIALFYINYQKKQHTKEEKSFKEESLAQLTAAYRSTDKDHFFLELHRILYRWISAQLDVPLANMNKKTAQSFLNNHPMPDEDRKQFTNLLNQCEQTLYMPGSIQSDTKQPYTIARQLLEKYL